MPTATSDAIDLDPSLPPPDGVMPAAVAEVAALSKGVIFYGDWNGDGQEEAATRDGDTITYQMFVGDPERYSLPLEGLTDYPLLAVKHGGPGEKDELVILWKG